MSKLAITRLESNVKSSPEKENKSLIVDSLDVKGASKGTKYFAILYKEIRSDLVYPYKCSNCNVTYYGKT